MAVANCPACGGRIEFAIGSSVVVVCDHCHSVIARTDRGVDDLGKVAAIIDTGSPLQRGLAGKYHGTGFRLTGRTQMRHQAGGVWDEWYAAFDDGRWGWLAEAQGKYYVTFKMPARDLPSKEEIAVGARVDGMVVSEIGTATVISGEGEIPWKVIPDSTYAYADLSGGQGHFATIDYSEEAPLLFKGQETTLPGLGIAIAPAAAERKVGVAKLSCSKCGGPLQLVAPDHAQRIICPNCGAVHDVAEGNLRYLETLATHGWKPPIALGSRGTVAGDAYVVAGAMLRSVTFDQKYYWTEYLLFNAAKGFRWLVDSDHHWSFVEPIAAGDVIAQPGSPAVTWDGKVFRIFQDAPATVERVLGEFYWKVAAGETVRAIDYIAPPEGITVEISGEGRTAEMNFSHGTYLPVDDVEKAFGVSGLPRPTTIGWLQPNPHSERVGPLWAKFAIALLVLAIVIGIARSGSERYNDLLTFATETPQGQWGASSPGPSHVIFTAPFELAGGRNVRVEGYSEVQNGWVYVAGDLINAQGMIVDSFQLPIEFYEGNDGGHWSEGSRTSTAHLAAVPAGRYTLRLEGDWDTAKISAPRILVKIDQGVFRWPHFWLAFALLTIPAMWAGLRSNAFEGNRWGDAMFTQSGQPRGGNE
ncbi:MAG TPA: DUF4178 domain-containing protein [Thermoanaerobaculia bacterium]|nr:DUF4178 domain-containing protein [Thermoanaerobaculia bacterium]